MDRRTKRKKLEAMANQSVSPEEAAIAREKLKDMPPDPIAVQPMLFGFRIFINGVEYNIVGEPQNIKTWMG